MENDPDANAELAEKFGSQPPEVMDVLHSILRLYGLDAQELFYKWEAYSINFENQSMDIDTVRVFKQNLHNELEKDMRGKARMQQNPVNAARTPRPQHSGGTVFDMLGNLTTPRASSGAMKRKLERAAHETPSKHDGALPQVAGSSPLPIRTPHKPSAPTESSTPFSKRTNAGETVEVLNAKLPKPTLPLDGSPSWDSRVGFLFNMDIRNFSYRPMYQKLAEAAEVQDERIDDLAAAIQEAQGLPDEAFGDPSVQNPNEIIAVGRIASDSLEGRLNAKSVLLETSRMTGNGARVPLNLDKIRSFSFFPGQVVCVRGTNTSGSYFSVNEIFEPPRLPPVTLAAKDLATHTSNLSAGPMTLYVASGPYTTDDNLLFESLDLLCTKVADARPDVVILTGPFIDEDHPLVQNGDFDLEGVDTAEGGTIEDLFKERISRKLRRIENSLVILVPALHDAVSKHLAFPQEGFKRKILDLPTNFKCLPNPSIFSLNEVAFGISTADILFHLSKEEVNRTPSEPNLVARYVSHVLSQRSFYPLFPPTARERLPSNVAGVNLDITYSRLADVVNITPDVLILPSGLPPFAKVVDGVVAFNPGTLSRKLGAGRYVEMVILPADADGKLEDDVVTNSVWKRARVEVVRI